MYFTEVTTSPVKQADKCGHVQGWQGGENTKTVRYISCLRTKSKVKPERNGGYFS